MGRGRSELRNILGALAVDFGNRDLGLLGLSKAGNSFANWAFAISLGVYGFDHGGATAVGVIALVRLAPGAIASPFAGLLSDRFSRRAVLIWSSLAVAAVLAAATVVAALNGPSWLILAFAGLFTVAISGYGPAEAAMLPLLARTPQELSAANVTHSTMENVGFLLAALVTGIILVFTSPAVVFATGAVVALATVALILGIEPDQRPEYSPLEGEISGIAQETTVGFRILLSHPALRLCAAAITIVVFFEGLADVLVVILALELLHLDHGSVGFLKAAWGVGALLGAAGLAALLNRGKLVVALVGGSLILGFGAALPGAWNVPFAAYAGWLAIGFGYTFIKVTAKILLQRLGSDETLGRVVGALWSARWAAMAIGSISASAIVALFGIEKSLYVLAAVMPAFALVAWSRLRTHEVGAPVAEEHFSLLRENSIFSPLPVATLEQLSRDLTPVNAATGEEVITQGDQGDCFYLIEDGEVEVFENGDFRRNEGPGESFGEIALLRDVPRTATVRATAPTRLLSLGREQFIGAVTGHRRSNQQASTVVDSRWHADEAA
ncbi:MAG TPA: MFS transporter [Solirubrobacterales bacterium]